MTPEDRIRMLMEENARLRAQLGQSPYADFAGGVSKSMPNAHGVTPEEYEADEAAAEELQRWQAERSYMGGGISDAMHRRPPAPTQYLRTETRRPSGRAVGLD